MFESCGWFAPFCRLLKLLWLLRGLAILKQCEVEVGSSYRHMYLGQLLLGTVVL